MGSIPMAIMEGLVLLLAIVTETVAIAMWLLLTQAELGSTLSHRTGTGLSRAVAAVLDSNCNK